MGNKGKNICFKCIYTCVGVGTLLFSSVGPTVSTLVFAAEDNQLERNSQTLADESKEIEDALDEPEESTDETVPEDSEVPAEPGTDPSSDIEPEETENTDTSSSDSSSSESTDTSNSTGETDSSTTGDSDSSTGSSSSSNIGGGTNQSTDVNEKRPSVSSPTNKERGEGISQVIDKDGAILYGKNQTTEEFIQEIGKEAMVIADKHDLYASVMIAQAILESASGNSALARQPNYNLFGIKGTFRGKSVEMSTLEDDGKGAMFVIKASFRKYPSYKESLEDYAKLLNTSFYSGVRKSNTTSYKDATAFLTGKYATDTLYNQKLNGLIAAYNLEKYDNAQKIVRKVRVTRHKVKGGETLWDISKIYGTTISRLKELNDIQTQKDLAENELIVVKRERIDGSDEKNAERGEKEKQKDKVERKRQQELALLKARQVAYSMTRALPTSFSEDKFVTLNSNHAKDAKTYRVKAGDTLMSIAEQTDVSIKELVEWNGLEDSVLIKGQVLVVENPYISLN